MDEVAINEELSPDEQRIFDGIERLLDHLRGILDHLEIVVHEALRLFELVKELWADLRELFGASGRQIQEEDMLYA